VYPNLQTTILSNAQARNFKVPKRLFPVFKFVRLLEVGVLLLVDFHDIMVGMDAASNILLFFLYTRIA
jgi:hypothetical protein